MLIQKNHVKTPTRGRVQPGAGFDLLRGVTRLQRPTSGLAHASVKPALGGKQIKSPDPHELTGINVKPFWPSALRKSDFNARSVSSLAHMSHGFIYHLPRGRRASSAAASSNSPTSRSTSAEAAGTWLGLGLGLG